MATAEATYDYQREYEPLPIEGKRLSLLARDAHASSREVDLAPLATLAAEFRTEYRVVVDVETDRGAAVLPLPLRVRSQDGNGSTSLRVEGSQYRLTLIFELTSQGGEIHWHLEPGGRDAAGRAAILDMLVAMSGSGVLVLRDDEHGVIARMVLEGNPLDKSLLEERHFLTDVLVIEAWSGVKLPLPDEIDDDQTGLIAQLVYWIRERKMRVRFTSEISGLTTEPVELADELRLHEHMEQRVLGVWVPVGKVNYRVPVRVIGSVREGGGWRTRFKPPDRWLTATITPPHGQRSIRGVRAVEGGEIPKPASRGRTRRQEVARENAEALVEEWDLTRPEDDEIRDEIRRRWPT